MKRFRGYIWVAIIIIGLILIKVLFLKSTSVAPAAGARKSTIQAVDALVVKPQELSNIAFVSGSLIANESADLQPQISGMVTGLFFKEGDLVHKGTLLVKINDASLQAQLKKQEAAYEISQSNLTREDQLFKLNAVNEDEYNASVLAVKSAQADMEFTKAEIDNCEIRAPFDGIIGVRFISPGAFVSPATVIATIYESNPIKVEFDLPEKFSSQIKIGTPITFKIQGNEKEYSGKVYVVNPGINAETRTLTVRALCSNDGSLRPGSFANITVNLGSNPSALLVPTQALIPVLNGQQLFVARHDSAFSVPVQIGMRNDTSVEITSGINPGDTVITSGIIFLKPKMQIKLKHVK